MMRDKRKNQEKYKLVLAHPVVVCSSSTSSTGPISSSCYVELSACAHQSQPPQPSTLISLLEARSHLHFATNLHESCSATTKSPYIKTGESHWSQDLQSPSEEARATMVEFLLFAHWVLKLLIHFISAP
ncbi:hypothetical protein DY000_02056245 [Brassica cretica]|uniref:Uncharacterized protein n=1 Tax=Brassica cretica TaxID=69181 RepID=A0ABQ7ALH2_BRACR|nr:hypothetical protein DY000_02056245 [Brassica cretica]